MSEIFKEFKINFNLLDLKKKNFNFILFFQDQTHKFGLFGRRKALSDFIAHFFVIIFFLIFFYKLTISYIFFFYRIIKYDRKHDSKFFSSYFVFGATILTGFVAKKYFNNKKNVARFFRIPFDSLINSELINWILKKYGPGLEAC